MVSMDKGTASSQRRPARASTICGSGSSARLASPQQTQSHRRQMPAVVNPQRTCCQAPIARPQNEQTAGTCCVQGSTDMKQKRTLPDLENDLFALDPGEATALSRRDFTRLFGVN